MIWLVALGSAVGGALRYVIGAALQQRAGTLFPVGTMTINIVGCFIIGVVLRVLAPDVGGSSTARVVLASGFCGGFTTYSAFAWETLVLFRDGDVKRGTLYMVATLGLCLAATAAGVATGGVVRVTPR